MSKITIVEPEVGTKDSVAEPRIPTALKLVEEFLNGNKIESTDNIKENGIAEASLSVALQEKLTVRLGFTLQKKNESLTGASEIYYEMEKAGSTLTLPAPTLNRIIGVMSVTTEVKVKPSSGTLFGDFLAGAAELVLAKNQHVILLADGTNWVIIAGEPKREQKYTTKVYTKEEAEAEVEISATRPAFVNFEGTPTALTIGGINILAAKNGVQYYVNPGQKWKSTGTVATVTTILL